MNLATVIPLNQNLSQIVKVRVSQLNQDQLSILHLLYQYQMMVQSLSLLMNHNQTLRCKNNLKLRDKQDLQLKKSQMQSMTTLNQTKRLSMINITLQLHKNMISLLEDLLLKKSSTLLMKCSQISDWLNSELLNSNLLFYTFFSCSSLECLFIILANICLLQYQVYLSPDSMHIYITSIQNMLHGHCIRRLLLFWQETFAILWCSDYQY